MDRIDEILNTAEWQWAADAESSRQSITNKHNKSSHHHLHQHHRGTLLRVCRHAVIARHMKLAELIGTAGEVNTMTTVNQEKSSPSSLNQWRSPESSRTTAPFHPLHCAASQGMLEDGMFLWEEAANNQVEVINIPDESDRTPLHWAAMTDRVDFVYALLDNGAEADMRDLAGRTPLFSAAAFGANRTVRVLLERGADKHGTDKRGLTPLHAAAAGGHIRVAAELLVVGADPTRRSRIGATPRHVAERQGHEGMVELLLIATESMALTAVAAATATTTYQQQQQEEQQQQQQQQQQAGSRRSNTHTQSASHLMRFDWQSAMMRSE